MNGLGVLFTACLALPVGIVVIGAYCLERAFERYQTRTVSKRPARRSAKRLLAAEICRQPCLPNPREN
jgi:hypothetical protein